MGGPKTYKPSYLPEEVQTHTNPAIFQRRTKEIQTQLSSKGGPKTMLSSRRGPKTYKPGYFPKEDWRHTNLAIFHGRTETIQTQLSSRGGLKTYKPCYLPGEDRNYSYLPEEDWNYLPGEDQRHKNLAIFHGRSKDIPSYLTGEDQRHTNPAIFQGRTQDLQTQLSSRLVELCEFYSFEFNTQGYRYIELGFPCTHYARFIKTGGL